jgi:hypothetical protein
MPRTDISTLPDESRIWIFGISPAVDADKRSRLLATVDSFLERWNAHNQPIVSARDVLHDSFLIVAVDQKSETSGCSIDRMFGLLQQIERELGVSILEPNRVFFRSGNGRVEAMSWAEFRHSGGPETLVFDTVAERLGSIRSGAWERAAAQSWHRALLASNQ